MTTEQLPRDAMILDDDVVDQLFPIKIELDLNDHIEVPDHIYDFLLERFRYRAEKMGYKHAHHATFEDWTISCVMRDYNE